MTMFPTNPFPGESRTRVPLNREPSPTETFLGSLSALSPETIGKIVAKMPVANYEQYYGDLSNARNITPIPRVMGANTFTVSEPRQTPVGFDAIVDASIGSGITERLFSMIENKYVNSTDDKIDRNSFFSSIESELKSTEQGRYIWYSRFLSGAYDGYDNSGALLSAISNDTERYKYLKTLATVSGTSDTIASYVGQTLDPVPLIVGYGAGLGAAGAIGRTALAGRLGSELLATEIGVLAYGTTREAVLQADDPERTAGDSTIAIGTDLLVGAALHGSIKGLVWGAGKVIGKPRVSVAEPTVQKPVEVHEPAVERVVTPEEIADIKQRVGESPVSNLSPEVQAKIDAGEAVTLQELSQTVTPEVAAVTPETTVTRTVLTPERLNDAFVSHKEMMDSLEKLLERTSSANEPLNTQQVLLRFIRLYANRFERNLADVPTFIKGMREGLQNALEDIRPVRTDLKQPGSELPRDFTARIKMNQNEIKTVVDTFTQKMEDLLEQRIDPMATLLNEINKSIDESLKAKAQEDADLIADVNKSIDEYRSREEYFNNLLKEINNDLDRLAEPGRLAENMKRGPDADINAIEASVEYGNHRDYFNQNYGNLEGGFFPPGEAVETKLALGFDPQSNVPVNSFLSRRTINLKAEIMNAVVEAGEDLTPQNMAAIDKQARTQAIMELAQLKNSVRFPEIPGQPTMKVVRVIDTEGGLQFVVESEQPLFVFDETNKVYIPKEEIENLRGIIDNDLLKLSPTEKLILAEEINKTLSKTYTLSDIRLADTLSDFAQTVEGPGVKQDILSIKNFITDYKFGFMSKIHRSVSTAFEEGFESVIEGILERSKVLENNPGILKFFGRPGVDPATGVAIITPASAEMAARRISKIAVNFAQWAGGGILALGLSFYGAKLAIPNAADLFSKSKDIDTTNLIVTRIVSDPEVFKSLYAGILQLPDNPEKNMLLNAAKRNFQFGADQDFMIAWNLSAISMIKNFFQQQTTNAVGLRTMTNQIIDSATVAYSPSFQKPFTKVASFASTLSEDDKQSLVYSIYRAEQAILSSNIKDPSEAMNNFGLLVGIDNDSKFWEATFPDINALFKNMNKQSVQGINGLGSDSITKANVAAVSAMYREILQSKNTPAIDDAFVNKALKGSSLRGIYNNSLLNRVDKMRLDVPYDTPIYAPEDGQALLLFSGLQSELRGKSFSRGQFDAAALTLPIADMLALRKVRNQLEGNRPKIRTEDYKQFDVIRNAKNIANRKKSNGSFLKEIEPKVQSSVLQEIKK